MSEVKTEDQKNTEERNTNEAPKELTEHDLTLITNQLDFYFSDSNYTKDKFILDYANKDEGWVPIDVFLKFNKIKKFTQDVDVIEKCFRKATRVTVSEDGKKVKRTAPVLDPEVLERRTVYASGFSTSKFVNKMLVDKAFSVFGKVNSVWNANDKNRKKRGVYVEFDSEETAKKALDAGTLTYNDEEKDSTLTIIPKKVHLVQLEEQAKKNEKHNNKNKKNNKRKRDDEENGNGTLTPGVILKILNYGDIIIKDEKFKDTADFFKQAFGEFGKVSYVDVSKEGLCIIRFKEALSAQNARKALVDEKKKIRDKELNAVLMEGDEEKQYWEENILNKPQNNNNQHKKKKRRFGNKKN